ncbi:hypothetical protein TNIN_477801 [Trichonephila inaurata madagascariensis]|uniref:Uncharacterized protein n=1 Tax=Trichonephila inaurata madagascariensis TaxID=2747483 RepID=A0A8X6XF46_9ARAC|nr:hypothetical protein TNIN_477801 [Trichonephila inaurata madagascariensis]
MRVVSSFFQVSKQIACDQQHKKFYEILWCFLQTFRDKKKNMDSKILCLNDFEEYAKKNMDRKTLAFYSQGAEREFTLKENVQCFTSSSEQEIRYVPLHFNFFYPSK